MEKECEKQIFADSENLDKFSDSPKTKKQVFVD